MADQSMTSPCTSICTLNDEDVCVGCYRTSEEIQNWRYLNNDQRQDVLVLCGERGAKANS
jgi:predicted Fe-S protein YdhL (DUF1289 family)